MDQTVMSGFGISLDERVQTSVDLLRYFEPKDCEYYGCFSGGKDSVVIKELARLAGVRVTWHYKVTTIDPPELVRFIRREHPDAIWVRNPKGPFFSRMVKKGFPTRRVRWCCEEFKETRPPAEMTQIMGIRAAESPRRAKTWKDVTHHTRNKTWMVAPILRWSNANVWEFIRSRKLPYCELYDQGFSRLGCIGCPMTYKRAAELKRYPGFEKSWKRAFRLLWEAKSGTVRKDGKLWFGPEYFNSWQEMWEWWLSNNALPQDDGEECQMDMWT